MATISRSDLELFADLPVPADAVQPRRRVRGPADPEKKRRVAAFKAAQLDFEFMQLIQTPAYVAPPSLEAQDAVKDVSDGKGRSTLQVVEELADMGLVFDAAEASPSPADLAREADLFDQIEAQVQREAELGKEGADLLSRLFAEDVPPDAKAMLDRLFEEEATTEAAAPAPAQAVTTEPTPRKKRKSPSLPSGSEEDVAMASSLAMVMRALNKYPLLSPAQTYDLGLRARAGDEEAINTLVCHNMRLAWTIARRSVPYSQGGAHRLLDAFQSGCMGLRHAATMYEPQRGNRFSTYAMAWVRNYVNDALRAEAVIHVSEHARTKLNKARRAHEQAVRDGEISESTRWESSAAIRDDPQAAAGVAALNVAQLDRPIGEGEDSLLDMVASDRVFDDPERAYEINETLALFLLAARKIEDPTGKRVWFLRYGLEAFMEGGRATAEDMEPPRSLREVAEILTAEGRPIKKSAVHNIFTNAYTDWREEVVYTVGGEDKLPVPIPRQAGTRGLNATV